MYFIAFYGVSAQYQHTAAERFLGREDWQSGLGYHIIKLIGM